jgi:undecaprenyl-diphosphatase
VKLIPLLSALAVAVYLAWRWRQGRRERGTLAAGLVLIGGLVVYGTGLVHPPSIDKLLEDAGRVLGRWTYLLVGTLAFLETGAFVGLIAPGETAILLGGLVAGQGEIDIVTLIAIVWACAVAGDVTSFLLGRRLGRPFLERHGPRFQITEPRLQQVERFFGKHGGKAILLGRFVGLVRAIAPFLAGSSGMAIRRFLPYDIVGAGLWGSTFAILGYVFWHSFDQVVAIAKKGAFALGTVIALTVAVVAAVRWLRVPANKERARAWLDAQAQRPFLRPVVKAVTPLARRGRKPARFVWNRVTPGDLGLELTTLAAVVLVGAFTFGGYMMVIGENLRETVGDTRAFELTGHLRTDVGIDVAKIVTALGAWPVPATALTLAAAYLLMRRHMLEGLTLLAGMALTTAAVSIAKAAEGRPRPLDPLVDTLGQSYPSGHTAYAVFWVAVAVALRHAFPGLASRAVAIVAALLIVVAVGVTRIYLRAHYLSDVVGGAAMAAALFALCAMGALVVAHLRQNEARA